MICRRCRQPIIKTPYGYGHAANPAKDHHYPIPASNGLSPQASVPGSRRRPAATSGARR